MIRSSYIWYSHKMWKTAAVLHFNVKCKCKFNISTASISQKSLGALQKTYFTVKRLVSNRRLKTVEFDSLRIFVGSALQVASL